MACGCSERPDDTGQAPIQTRQTSFPPRPAVSLLGPDVRRPFHASGIVPPLGKRGEMSQASTGNGLVPPLGGTSLRRLATDEAQSLGGMIATDSLLGVFGSLRVSDSGTTSRSLGVSSKPHGPLPSLLGDSDAAHRISPPPPMSILCPGEARTRIPSGKATATRQSYFKGVAESLAKRAACKAAAAIVEARFDAHMLTTTPYTCDDRYCPGRCIGPFARIEWNDDQVRVRITSCVQVPAPWPLPGTVWRCTAECEYPMAKVFVRCDCPERVVVAVQ
jgi:hypothetical protein